MKTVRLLIADDHDIIREGLRTILAAMPWTICAEAGNGREAVALARQYRPDVVVMDFSMPDLNGVEAARQIRKELPRTEVLMLTMHDSEQLAREALAAGARGFLLKTDVKRHLIPAVQTLVEHKPYFAAHIYALLLENFLHPPPLVPGPSAGGERLTPREREVVQLVAEGQTSKAVAQRLNISVKTVDAHRVNILRKLGLHSVSELVRYAVRNQIIQP